MGEKLAGVSGVVIGWESVGIDDPGVCEQRCRLAAV